MRSRPDRRSVLAAVASLPLTALAASARAAAPVVAAAADLQFALSEIAADFTAATGVDLRLVFGSTGNLARQIRQGAPFALFLAADERFVLDLHRDGFTQDAGHRFAEGRLALLVPRGSPLAPDATLDSLRRLLALGRLTRFAIANPEHAPYGQRAEEVLRHAGLWEAIAPHLVLGENVSQAAQFALSGNAEGGIVALSLALAPGVAARGEHAPIAAGWHRPLLQRMVRLHGAGPEAAAFEARMQSAAARAVLQRYGFTLPGGA
jgi:molybdate transport system substrate-binding protein